MWKVRLKCCLCIRRLSADPSAPIPPLPLHLHPPPARSGCASPPRYIFFFSSLSSPPVAGFLLNGVFSFRKEPPDPNAPLPPLPLHLHPPPPPKRASVEEKPDGSGSDELPSACMRTLRNEPESHRCVFAAAGRNQRPNLHHRRRKQLIS